MLTYIHIHALCVHVYICAYLDVYTHKNNYMYTNIGASFPSVQDFHLCYSLLRVAIPLGRIFFFVALSLAWFACFLKHPAGPGKKLIHGKAMYVVGI